MSTTTTSSLTAVATANITGGYYWGDDSAGVTKKFPAIYYDSGTWTPSLGGSTTYTTRVGTYVKLGLLVIAEFDIQVNTIGTGSATTVSGLPFTTAATPALFGGTVNFFSGLLSNVVFLNYSGGAGTTSFTFQALTAAGASLGGFSAFTSGTRIAGTVIYIAST